MPRTYTTTTTAYQFSELSDKAKEKAIEHCYYYNVDHDWWEFIFEDAKEVGLKITGFDIDRGSYCEIEFIESAETVGAAILKNHSESCETYQTARNFLIEHNRLILENTKISELIDAEYDKDERYDLHNLEDQQRELENRIEELKDEFLNDLSNDYLKILRDEYEYMTSKDAIIETIEVNEYEFDEDGNQL
jgi:hypothetical protein